MNTETDRVSHEAGQPPPTIRTVATLAGVSVGTVSNAINSPSRLAPNTLRRVHEAIATTGFIRSSAASSLARKSGSEIGLVIPDMDISLWVDLARGAQRAAQESDLKLLIAMTGFSMAEADIAAPRSDEESALEHFAEARAAGVLLATMTDPRVRLRRIREHVRSAVVINWDDPEPDWCTVLMDNELAGCLAVEHLADSGFTRLYFVSPPDVVQPISLRRRGMRGAAERRGVHVIDVLARDLGFKDGVDAAGPLVASWSEGERYAIVGVTDALARGALETVRRRPGPMVPRDIAVVGLDGDRNGGTSRMPLTSIEVPALAMGRAAVALLGAELDEVAAGTHAHRRVVLPVELIPRQSSMELVPE